MRTTRTPAFIAYAVAGEGRQAYWSRIGPAWPHLRGEGFNIEFAALPLDARIILMPPKVEQASEHEVTS